MAETSYLEAIRRGLFEEMARDPRVFLIGEDIGRFGGAFKVTKGLFEEFGPNRVIDTPISEEAIVGAAIGAGYNGMIPVCEMQFMDFVSSAFNLITNFAAKSRYRWGGGVPITIRGPVGAGVSGGPFHSQSPEVFFCSTPGLKVVAPATAYDALGLIKSSIRDPDPVLFLEHKFLYRRIREDLPEEEFLVPLGKARVAREGEDLLVITYGAQVHVALKAAEALSREDVEVEVLDLRTLAPIDQEAVLESVRKIGKVLLLHEANRTGGLGGELAAQISEFAFEYLDAPVRRLASLDTPVPFAPPLEAAFLPGEEDVLRVLRELHAY
jgi:2-oxoisovalerate dehydrogenase E1 component beta subunit